MGGPGRSREVPGGPGGVSEGPGGAPGTQGRYLRRPKTTKIVGGLFKTQVSDICALVSGHASEPVLGAILVPFSGAKNHQNHCRVVQKSIFPMLGWTAFWEQSFTHFCPFVGGPGGLWGLIFRTFSCLAEASFSAKFRTAFWYHFGSIFGTSWRPENHQNHWSVVQNQGFRFFVSGTETGPFTSRFWDLFRAPKKTQKMENRGPRRVKK